MHDERVGSKKEKHDNSQKVYEKEHCIILKVKSGKKNRIYCVQHKKRMGRRSYTFREL